MTISVWQRTPAREQVSCDVAIIGAGITGLSAAIECESRGLSAAILESEWAGAKASGRNAGFLIRGAAENYARASERYGRDAARSLWSLTEENLRQLRALGLESTEGYRAIPSCVAATGEDELAQLHASHDMLIADGFDSELVSVSNHPDDALWRRGAVIGGLINPGDAVCSPYELVRLLGAALSATPLFESAEVYRIETEPTHTVVRTPGVEVHASRVLVCTNAYAPSLCPALRGVIAPNRGQMLACRPEDPRDADLQCAYYLNHGSEYIRRGAPGEILIGGARAHHAQHEATASDDTSAQVQDRLERFVRELVTDSFLVTARWAGIMGFTPDALPIVAQVDPAGNPSDEQVNEHGNDQSDGRVWFCGGLTGHGMSMGHALARHAVGVMIGAEPTRFGLGRLAARA